MARADARAEAEKVFAAEAAISGIRVAVIALNSIAYAFWLPHAGTFPWLAYLVILTANAYGVGVFAFQPYRRFPVMLSSYFTTALDAAFITVWLLATGGFASPFYLLWMLSVTAVAFRFDMRATLFAAGVYAASYVGLLAALGQLAPHAADVAIRVAYVFLVAALGGFLSRELYETTREKVELEETTAALRESEERFRRLSDATFEAIAIHDGGIIREANAAAARMFGYDRAEDMVGVRAADLVDPVSLPTLADRLAAPRDDPYMILAKRRDGSTFDAEVTARDLPFRGHTARVVAMRDVTERKKAERVTLEREALAIQNERLREMDSLKSRFINSAAHELGTPLTPIKLQAHLLKLGGLGELNDRQRHAVDVLSRNVDHLGLMVKDLLDASRVQSGELKLRRTRIDLSSLLQDAVDAFGASTVGVALDAPSGLMVDGDAARLTQVAFNLLGNALKFTPPGGRIEVRARRVGSEVVVDITDTGAGIAPAELEKLFRPFSQVHDTNAQTHAGAGLGLFISKGIVESHGGRIWAASAGPGRGSTFSFAIPAAAIVGTPLRN